MTQGEATASQGTGAGTLAVWRAETLWCLHGEVFKSFREKLGVSWASKAEVWPVTKTSEISATRGGTF